MFRWRHNASLQWNLGKWGATLSNRFMSGYTDQSTTFQQGDDPRYTDPLGRTWYARVTYKF